MLAAEYATLSKPMKDQVRRFFDVNEAWLVDVLQRGRDNAELAFEGSPVEAARVLIAALEGGMLVARSLGEPSRLQAIAQSLLANICIRPRHPAG